MLVLVLGVALAALLFYYYLIKPHKYWKQRGVKQGKPWLILGDTWGTTLKRQNVCEMVQYVYNQCPGTRYSGMYQFNKPTLVVKDPELIKEITVKDFEHFSDHSSVIPEDVDPLWTKNLVALKGQKWRDMRAILSPSFTSSKMKAMFVLISECAENFVQHFLKKDEDTVSIELKETFTRFANDVIATTAFGVKVDSLGDPTNAFFLMGKEATDFSSYRKLIKFTGFVLFPKLFRFLKITLFGKELNDFFTDLVEGTIKARKEKGIVRPDMIHLLMEAQRGVHKQEEDNTIDTGFATALESIPDKGTAPVEITTVDITAQAIIFFFAGFETVSFLMSFATYELAVNPDIQERLREEVRTTLKQNGRKLTYEGLLKMKYMDMVISETLRKWPIGLAADRVCTKPYTIEPKTIEERPVHIEKKTAIFIPIFAIHRDPDHYPNPERFDPERFSDENKCNIKPYTYLPFGLGPRNCIGSRFALLETKAVLFHLLQHFEIVPVEKSEIPLKISKKKMNMSPQDGFWFGLKQIKEKLSH